MPEIDIRKEGRAGRITLMRPKALNALTAEMSLAIDQALENWRADTSVQLILIDAEGEKAFCAGGDIADLYARGQNKDFDFGRNFWRQEYRMNLMIADYPKPVVTFMQGFTMGGGVGVGCHASHRIVGESSKIAMPECGIGLIPDVGGSWLLARAPDGIGVFLGLTAARMSAGDAIFAGFADSFVPEASWPDLSSELAETGDVSVLPQSALSPASLTKDYAQIADCFAKGTVAEIAGALERNASEPALKALKFINKASPLAMSGALRTIHAAHALTLRQAFAQEYRFSYRSQEQGDLQEGIRAQIIDRDFEPNWRHNSLNVPDADVDEMLAPLGPHEWNG